MHAKFAHLSEKGIILCALRGVPLGWFVARGECFERTHTPLPRLSVVHLLRIILHALRNVRHEASSLLLLSVLRSLRPPCGKRGQGTRTRRKRRRVLSSAWSPTLQRSRLKSPLLKKSRITRWVKRVEPPQRLVLRQQLPILLVCIFKNLSIGLFVLIRVFHPKRFSRSTPKRFVRRAIRKFHTATNPLSPLYRDAALPIVRHNAQNLQWKP